MLFTIKSSIKLLSVDQKYANKWSLIKNNLWSKIEFCEEGGKQRPIYKERTKGSLG